MKLARVILTGGFMLMLLAPVSASLAQDGEDAEIIDSGDVEITESGPVKFLTKDVPKVKGPRRMVSVGKFDAIGAFRQAYGDWDIGGGVSSMLTSALVESERFIVLERSNIQQILSEQQMKGQGVAGGDSGPELGKVTSANIMIYGSVTEFNADDKGSGFSVGASGGSGLGKLFGGALSSKKTTGKITLDVRLVDTTSSQVIETYRISHKVKGKGFDVSVGYGDISMGTDNFAKTPLGEATRRSVEEIVRKIAKAARKIPWTGRVVEVSGDEIFINAGAKSGLGVGDTFVIERIMRKLTDPDTGAVLKVIKRPLGAVTITGVEEKISWGNYSPVEFEEPLRGDLVGMLKQ